MTALSDTVAILATRHDAILAAYADALTAAQQEAIAGEALAWLVIDPAAAALLDAQLPSVRRVLDVMAWRWVERRTGLLFDFAVDGGNYRRSQLAESAMRLRRLAEDAAAAAGLAGFWPDVEVTRLVPGDGTICVSL